jgi:hypothetical protein
MTASVPSTAAWRNSDALRPAGRSIRCRST